MARPSKRAIAERKRRQAAERRARRTVELLERATAALDEEAFADACVIACEGCGLEQVQNGPAKDLFVLPCVVCGCEVGRFVKSLPIGERVSSVQMSTLDVATA